MAMNPNGVSGKAAPARPMMTAPATNPNNTLLNNQLGAVIGAPGYQFPQGVLDRFAPTGLNGNNPGSTKLG